MKIALISCVKEKAEQPCEAISMYKGEAFRQWIDQANELGAEQIFILSGKYGLLETDQVIKPYDLDLTKQEETYRIEWGDNVIKKLLKLSEIEKDHFLIFAHPSYYSHLIPHMRSFEIIQKVS